MIRHIDEVVCDRCHNAIPFQPGNESELESGLRSNGWFVGGIGLNNQKIITHLCPPCYQSLENWAVTREARTVVGPKSKYETTEEQECR